MRRLLQLTLFCLLAITTVIQTFAADPVYTIDFANKNPTWTNSNAYKDVSINSRDGLWTLTNASNNNNNWAYIRLGYKGATTTTTLASTGKLSEAIASIKFNIKAWKREGTIKGVSVEVCPDNSFEKSSTSTYVATSIPTYNTTGEVVINISDPKKNQYYKVNISVYNPDKKTVV